MSDKSVRSRLERTDGDHDDSPADGIKYAPRGRVDWTEIDDSVNEIEINGVSNGAFNKCPATGNEEYLRRSSAACLAPKEREIP